MNVEPTDLIWMNGRFVAWEDAKVHVLTHGLHYGTGVFDSMRCYDTELGPAVFRNVEHLERLHRSADLYYMPVPYSVEELRAATLELVARNGLRSCYIRPIVNRGYGQMGLNPLDAPVDVTIACWEWGSYLGEEGVRNGVRAKVSSWRRISPDSLIPHAKASGQYLNSVLAKVESLKAGYQEAILLDDHGHVCEGTGENIYVVRDGEIATPGQHNSILDGITRRSIIQIAQDLGYSVVERNVARAEMYLADEVFMSGTAAELVPVREIDDHTIGTGRPGEITRVLQAEFDDAVHGRSERYREWLDVVQAPALDTSTGEGTGVSNGSATASQSGSATASPGVAAAPSAPTAAG
jgi:branched-chain amino acid aminotransferase